MKRIISIFLLLIMLAIGIHPVLAIHSCAGGLFSVNLIHPDQQNHCCCKDLPEEDCESDSQSRNDNYSAFTGVERSCCDFKQVELFTDDFDYQVQQLNLNNVLPSFNNVWLVLNDIFNYTEADNLATVRHIFPPGGLDKLNIDLLTYICIYRI